MRQLHMPALELLTSDNMLLTVCRFVGMHSSTSEAAFFDNAYIVRANVNPATIQFVKMKCLD